MNWVTYIYVIQYVKNIKADISPTNYIGVNVAVHIPNFRVEASIDATLAVVTEDVVLETTPFWRAVHRDTPIESFLCVLIRTTT